MGSATVTAPDGREINVDFPDGTPEHEIFSRAMDFHQSQINEMFKNDFESTRPKPSGKFDVQQMWGEFKNDNPEANKAAIAANESAREGAISRGDIVTPVSAAVPMAIASGPVSGPLLGRALQGGIGAGTMYAAEHFNAPDWLKNWINDQVLVNMFGRKK